MWHTRRKFVALGISVALATGGGIAALTLTATGAAAVGTTHKLNATTKQNLSTDIEKPSFAFSCNDVTGKYSLKVSNVQVIQDDRLTRWTTLAIYVYIYTPDMGDYVLLSVGLSQNSTSGLFGGASSGILPQTVSSNAGVTVCEVGDQVAFVDADTQAGFQFTYDLT